LTGVTAKNLPFVFMMHLPGLVLLTLFLRGVARRSLRIDDSHHDAQLQNNTVAKALQLSAEVWNALIPGRIGNPMYAVRRAGARRTFGPHRAKGGLHAAGVPTVDQLPLANRLPPPVMHVRDAYVPIGDSVARHREVSNTRAAAMVAKPNSETPVVDFWLLTANMQPATSDVVACRAVVEQQRRGDADGVAAALEELSTRPVIVEKRDRKERRVFELPGGVTPVTLRELTFGTAGIGHSVWDAGVALSLWLSQHSEAVRGKRVLELGSGVGISGIAAAACGASHVTLSDYGYAGFNGERRAFEEDEASARAEVLRDNLKVNARLSRVHARCEAIALDWHASLRSGFEPSRRYEVIVGSDLVYYEEDVDALVATIVAHLQPGATCHLMSRQGRTGLPQLLSALGELGDVTTEELAVVNSFGRTELCRIEFVSPP